MANKDLAKKEVLPDSKMPVSKGQKNEHGKNIRPIKGPRYDAAADIKKFGLKPTEVVEYRDPFTDTVKKIMIDRRGTTEEKLALALLDDKVSREQKDSMVSMYLFEKGKHGASMMMDLWQYKGQHTKESRQFQSTMRFDFELFLQTFQIFMQDSADLILKELPIGIEDVEFEEDGKKVVKKIPQLTRDVEPGEIALMLGELAQYFRMTSDLLGKRIRAEVDKRERAKGKGIYVGLDDKPYSVYEDGDIVEVVNRDREEAKKEKDGTTN